MLVVHVAALPAVYHNHLPSAFFSHNHTNTYTCLSTHGRAQVARGKEGGGGVCARLGWVECVWLVVIITPTSLPGL